MNIKILEGYVEFFNFLNDYELQGLSPSFQPFLDAYSVINKGCGCGKAKRMADAENLYKDIVSITLQVDPDLVNEMKLKAQVGEIQMYWSGNLIYKG